MSAAQFIPRITSRTNSISDIRLSVALCAAILSHLLGPAAARAGDVTEVAAKSATSPDSDDTSGQTTTGLFMGYIYFIEPSRISMVVNSAEKEKPRKVFYLDRHTVVMDGRKKRKIAALEPGDKVAVWFFSEKGTYVAERVFLVEGEFRREEYMPRTVFAPDASPSPNSATEKSAR